MAVSTVTQKIVHSGDGVQTQFTFPYAFHSPADLHVIIVLVADGTETEWDLDIDYSVAPINTRDYADGAYITTVTTLTSDYEILIERIVELKQLTDYDENDSFPAETHEKALDYLTFISQQLKDKIDRSIHALTSELGLDMELPPADERAGRIAGYNANGEPTVFSGVLPGDVSVSAFMEGHLLDGTAAQARSTLGVLTEAETDHDNLINTHDLTTDIDHATITNGHNLTSDIDHSLIAGGHLAPKTVTKTADYTILDTDDDTYYICAPAAAVMEIELPTASANANSILTFIQGNGDYETTITAEFGNEINDIFTSVYLNRAGQKVTLICDGSNWWKLDGEPSYMSGHIAMGGGFYSIPLASRPASWLLNAGNSTSWFNAWVSAAIDAYIPDDIPIALQLKWLLRWEGDGSTDVVDAYIRPTGSTAIDTEQVYRVRTGLTNYTSGDFMRIGGQIVVECSSVGKVDYYVSHANLDLYLNVEGYYVGM